MNLLTIVTSMIGLMYGYPHNFKQYTTVSVNMIYGTETWPLTIGCLRRLKVNSGGQWRGHAQILTA